MYCLSRSHFGMSQWKGSQRALRPECTENWLTPTDALTYLTSPSLDQIRSHLLPKERVNQICDPLLKSAEIKHLKKAIEANGYPRSVITQTMRRQKPPQENENQSQDEPQEKQKVPYVRNASEEIERECSKLGIKAVFQVAWHTSAGSDESEDSQRGSREERRHVWGSVHGLWH